MDSECKKASDDFLDLLIPNQVRIYAYILSMVRNYHDADDVLQDTVKTMFEKYEESKPIDNFVAWGIQIAYFKILDFRKKKANSKVQYDQQLFEKFSDMVEQKQTKDDSVENLEKCIRKLNPRARKMVELRYYQDFRPRQISSLIGLSVTNVYKIMSRIHGKLLACLKAVPADERYE
ncbi:RNA polymerase sigma factor [Sedimentisphaera cyanobacteriorum]|uniref:RNA polymerase sigma factor n=1 Tax=Sedimentisphaera cyanobacteriorum TaxID=1940790 RepID=A0A1Q2HLS1_9BACT|nr:sigma-70 family RNA polymerase sigma factor [Sedimentisphaera cyanobacteriorum]AQQ08300.1 RNA polymerase sigma factor [Sedimentisphaera cyanobacteriorum]